MKLVALRYHDWMTSGSRLAEAISKRNRFGPDRQDLWAVHRPDDRWLPDGQQQQRDEQRGNRRRQPDAHELAQRNADAQAPAAVKPQQSSQRSDRQQPRAEVAANQDSEELAWPRLGP